MSEYHLLGRVFFERRAELRRYFAARVGDGDADDLVQEVWIRICRLSDAHQPEVPVAYLYRLAANIMLDRIRHDRSRSRRDGDWYASTRSRATGGDEVSEESAADRALIARERVDRIHAVMLELPDAVQRTFRLHKLEGLTYGEVADRLGVSRSLVEKHMMRALKHLVLRMKP